MASKENTDRLLQGIANTLTVYGYHVIDNSLFYGKGGIVMYLYAYAAYSGDEAYEDFAGDMLDIVMADTKKMKSDFDRGFTGIGWLLHWLIKRGYVEGDVNDVLKAYDKAMFARIECEKESDPALQTLYLTERLEQVTKDYDITPLAGIFLRILAQRLEKKDMNRFQASSVEKLIAKTEALHLNEKNHESINNLKDKIRKEADKNKLKEDTVNYNPLYYSANDLIETVFLPTDRKFELSEEQTNFIIENYIKNAEPTSLHLFGGLAGLGVILLENNC